MDEIWRIFNSGTYLSYSVHAFEHIKSVVHEILHIFDVHVFVKSIMGMVLSGPTGVLRIVLFQRKK